MAPRLRIQHHPATDGRQGRVETQHQPIPPGRGQGFLQIELDQTRARARGAAHRLLIQQHQACEHLAAGVVHVHALAVLDDARIMGHDVEPHVQATGDLNGLVGHDLVAALHLVLLDAVQGQGQALARGAVLVPAPVHLDFAHPHGRAGGLDRQLVALLHRTAPAGAGDHDPGAGQGEDPVHGQAEGALLGPDRQGQGFAPQGTLENLESRARVGGNRHHRLAFQERAGHQLDGLLAGHGHEILVHHVGLGDDYHAALHAQRVEDLQMLHRLGHDPLVGSHHQESQVHAAGAGDHLLDELLVPGHVDHAQLDAAAQVELGETQLDADAPLLLLLEAVGVGAGQRGDQGGLAVVNVAGGAEDVVAFGWGHGSSRPGPGLGDRRSLEDSIEPGGRKLPEPGGSGGDGRTRITEVQKDPCLEPHLQPFLEARLGGRGADGTQSVFVLGIGL